MTAIWVWVRSEWRRGWGGLVVLGLLITIAGGVAMAASAGARRADSAIARFQSATNDPQVGVELASTDLDELQAMMPRLPSPSELADRLAAVDGVDGVTVIDFVAATPDPDAGFFNAALGAQRGRASSDLLIEGRRFDPNDPYEVMVNETAAAQWGEVGSMLTLHTLDPTQLPVMAGIAAGEPAGPMIEVRVVGILRGIEEITDVPEPILISTPAFVDRFADEVAMFPGTAFVVTDTDRADELVADLGAAAGEDFVAHLPDEDFAGRIDETVSVEVTAMWVFALAAAAAGLVIVYQAMRRQGPHLAPERSTRQALGFTRQLDVAAFVLRAVPSIVVGAAGSVALALALSPLFPRGIARRAEPSAGVLADRPVLAVGATAIVLVGVAIAATSGWVLHRSAADLPRRKGAGLNRVAGALRPTAGLGLRLAFSGSRRVQASRAGVIGVAIAVAGLLAVTAVERSADRLTTTPRLYGAGWDAVVALDPAQRPDALLTRLGAEPDVVGIGTLDTLAEEETDAVGPGGTAPVEPEALVARQGSITQTLTAGRLPAGPGEVAIGDTVSELLGADIGDTVVVTGYRDEVRLVVVGRVLSAGTNELGNGFDVTSDGLEAITAGCPDDSADMKCQIYSEGIGVAFREGVDVDEAVARLGQIDKGFVATPVPSVVYNLRQIGATPWYLAAFLAVLGMSGLAHALATGRRLGRHDLAVTRALGLAPRQTAGSLCWQALVIAVAGGLAGALLGLIAGRLAWRQVAEGTGALVETVVPAWAWVVAPGVALIVALGLAIVPAARIAGERPAEILRTE
jgi:FtsX-like permease family